MTNSLMITLKKHRILIVLLCLEILILVPLCITLNKNDINLFRATNFPFGYIADFLSFLSGLGKIGSGFAVCIFTLIGSIPLLFLFFSKNCSSILEKIALVLMSVTLWTGLYGMNHPFDFLLQAGATDEMSEVLHDTNLFLFSILIWSSIIFRVVTYLIRTFTSEENEKLQKYLRILLSITGLAYLAVAVINGTAGFLISSEQTLTTADVVLLVICLVADIIEAVLFTLIAVLFSDLTGTGDDASATAKNVQLLTAISTFSLKLIAGFTLFINLLQLFLVSGLSSVSINAHLPIVPLLVIMLILLFARQLVSTRTLQEENDMFI